MLMIKVLLMAIIILLKWRYSPSQSTDKHSPHQNSRPFLFFFIFFAKIAKLSLTLIWKCKDPRTAKVFLKKNRRLKYCPAPLLLNLRASPRLPRFLHQVSSLLRLVTWVGFVFALFCRQKLQGAKNVGIQKFMMDLSKKLYGF